MEIKDDIPDFSILNLIVSETLSNNELSSENRYVVQMISKLYYDFIRSDKSSLSIKVPINDIDIINYLNKYLYYFDLLIKLIDSQSIVDLSDTTILDVFHTGPISK